MAKKSLAEQTAQKIKTMIQEEHYEPGQKLPTEYELCNMLSVGRNTLREAVRILQSLNLVTIRQGSGTYISDKYGVPDDPFGFDLYPDHVKLTRDIMQVLTVLVPEMVVLAAENRTADDIDNLEECLSTMAKKLDQGLPVIDEEVQFYQLLAESSHNVVMERMMPLVNQAVRYFAATLRSKDFMYGARNYRSVLSAVKRGKPSEGKSAMNYHLLFLARQYLLVSVNEYN